MKIITNGRNIQLTDAIKQYVSEKFDRLSHHFDFIREVHVFLSVEKNPRISDNQLAEATIHVSGAVIRMEVSTDNLYASIDALVDKVDRSLNKHKTKLLHRAKSGRTAKGDDSIRRVGLEDRLAEAEQVRREEEELDGIIYTYDDEPVSGETPVSSSPATE